MKSASSILSLAIIAGLSQSAYAADFKAANAGSGEILVLLSSENVMQLVMAKQSLQAITLTSLVCRQKHW